MKIGGIKSFDGRNHIYKAKTETDTCLLLPSPQDVLSIDHQHLDKGIKLMAISTQD